jgi:hypothetical protein
MTLHGNTDSVQFLKRTDHDKKSPRNWGVFLCYTLSMRTVGYLSWKIALYWKRTIFYISNFYKEMVEEDGKI